MNIKFVAGFLAGIILVVLVWPFFPDIRERFLPGVQSVKNISQSTLPEEKKEGAQETNLLNKSNATKKNPTMETGAPTLQSPVENQIDTADAVTGEGGDEIDLKKSTHEQNHVSWAEVDRSSPEVEAGLEGNEVLPANQTDTLPNDPKKEGLKTEDEFKITDHVSDMEVSSNTPAIKDSKTVLTASDGDGEEKFFFWKPFFLESKAKNFAAQITSVSTVNCLVDKTETGNYQVYYRYKDETDKLAKAERIKNIGIAF